MDSSDNSVTTCRLCHHYSPEGRRGGFCKKLDVPVLSQWDACSLAAHPFDSACQSINMLNTLLHESLLESTSIGHNAETAMLQNSMSRSLSLSEN